MEPMNIPPTQTVEKRQEYNIDNHRNIIPLNGGHSAFKTQFTARSEGKFKGVVVDQTTLDMSNELEYRDSTTTAEGEWFNGELEYVDSIPRQFYLVLLAEQPTIVVLDTKIEPRESKPQLPPQIPIDPAPVPEQSSPTKMTNWFLVGVAVIIVVVVGALLLSGRSSSVGGIDIDSLLADF